MNGNLCDYHHNHNHQQQHHQLPKQYKRTTAAAVAPSMCNHNSRSITNLANTTGNYLNYNQCNCVAAQHPATAAAAAIPPPHLQSILGQSNRHCCVHTNGGGLNDNETSASANDRSNRITDEDDSAFPGLLEREFHFLHRNVPALRRSGVDTNAIRQHFYPDGGWGWIICSISFLAHLLTSGLQLSYCLLLVYAVKHLNYDDEPQTLCWLGAASWSVSTLATPFVIAFCRKKSTRLSAVLGGLILPLGILFTSFATQLGQVIFSYGFVIGIGVAMVRESSTIMLGNYFKKRREFVEAVAMLGEGIGIALFSVILKEGVGKLGWRLGLQTIAAMATLSFFMGLLYRSASLYHPQRRAIQHLKNQRRKVKEKKRTKQETKSFLMDLEAIKSTTVKILLLTSAISAFGIYTPIFILSLYAGRESTETTEKQDSVLLQTFLGLSMAVGVVSSALIIRKSCIYKYTFISIQHVCQISVIILAVCILFLSFVFGFHANCILCWIYGINFGAFRYTFKMLVLERIKTKQFARVWGFIRGVESIPVLISVPLTSFLNDYSLKYGRAGYFICAAAAAIAGIVIFFIGNSSTGRASDKNCNSHFKNYANDSLKIATTAATNNCPLVVGMNEYPPDLLHRGTGHHQIYIPPASNHLHVNAHPYSACAVGGNSLHRSYQNIAFNQQHHHQQQQHPLQHHHPHHHSQQQLHNQNFAYNSLPRQYSRQIGSGYNKKYETSSLGRNSGKQLQRSLSFAHYPYFNNCECIPNYEFQERYGMNSNHNEHYNNSYFANNNYDNHGHHDYYLHQMQQHPHQQHPHHQHYSRHPAQQNYFNCNNPSRSLSVPEGLSIVSEQCTCSTNMYNTSTAPAPTNSSQRLTRQRSQSLSKPMHVIEQITTSV
ncbi:hypothetical protein ACFFRR_004369 [Megaselia abdita]